MNECDPCQRHHRSHAKERVEVSHTSMFNIRPGHTIHMDFCTYSGVNYVFLVDRLTSYIQVENFPNQCTSSAILAVKRWASKFRFPYKIIADGGGGFRDDFITQLEGLGIDQKPSNAYHSESNSPAERAVGSLKNVLKK